jgi:hypothetical protein
MTSSFPQPANKTYDQRQSEVLAHLAIHDTLGCAERCQHIKALQFEYGLVTVSIALDKFAQTKAN